MYGRDRFSTDFSEIKLVFNLNLPPHQPVPSLSPTP
jgi:hypothetical protein